MDYMGVLVGLGNPGTRYADTRHNCGFAFVADILERAREDGELVSLSGQKFSCELWRLRLPELQGWWLAACPQTFMNLSGQCVQPLLAWHKLGPDSLLVIHDELDIPPGALRFKKGGGNAGHNGLKSITEQLGTPNFYRLRIGIGRPPHKSDVLHWVLSCPSSEDAQRIAAARHHGLQVLRAFTERGLEEAAATARHVS